jgi:transposase
MTDHHTTVDTTVDTTGHGTLVTGGVDTHKDTHTAAVRDHLGRLLGTRGFPTNPAGYIALLSWVRSFGTVAAIGVEGTGSYGAGLARHLTAHDITVHEVNRGNRQQRRRKGKSDTQDAINAAAAVQSGEATATPKAGTGVAAAITALRTVRAGAVKSRTAALNQLDGLIVTAPVAVRETLTGLTGPTLVATCARLRPSGALTCPSTATKTALRRLARRIQQLTREIDDTDTELTPLIGQAVPRTIALFGVGPDSAGRMLVTIGDNPGRIDNDARFAHLCGVAPIEASSGRTTGCFRLDRGGDRQANAALYRIVIVRMRHCARTRAYVARRTTEGKSKRHIIRCLKRYVAREVFHALIADMNDLANTT